MESADWLFDERVWRREEVGQGGLSRIQKLAGADVVKGGRQESDSEDEDDDGHEREGEPEEDEGGLNDACYECPSFILEKMSFKWL